MDLYAEIILDHYKNPHHHGTIHDATLSAEDSNPLCGDTIRMDLKLDDAGRIVDVAFSGVGCAISQASASMLTDELIGKSLAEASTMRNDALFDLLQIPLTPSRVKCALLSLAVVKKAITLYHLSRQ